MRALLLEAFAVALASVVLVCALLGLLPGDGTLTWTEKSVHLLRTAFTLDFDGQHWANPSALAVVSRAFALSVTVVGVTAALLVAVAMPLGVLSVTRSREPAVQFVRKALTSVSSIPVLVLGTIVFMIGLRVFHITLRDDTALRAALVAAILTLLLGDRLIADMVQRVEIATRAILDEPYMKAVRAGNLGFRRHLLQSLCPPVAEALFARSMFLVSGAIVVEVIFYINGLGLGVAQALALSHDPRKILAFSMALIALGLAFRLLHAAALGAADPRRRT